MAHFPMASGNAERYRKIVMRAGRLPTMGRFDARFRRFALGVIAAYGHLPTSSFMDIFYSKLDKRLESRRRRMGVPEFEKAVDSAVDLAMEVKKWHADVRNKLWQLKAPIKM